MYTTSSSAERTAPAAVFVLKHSERHRSRRSIPRRSITKATDSVLKKKKKAKRSTRSPVSCIRGIKKKIENPKGTRPLNCRPFGGDRAPSSRSENDFAASGLENESGPRGVTARRGGDRISFDRVVVKTRAISVTRTTTTWVVVAFHTAAAGHQRRSYRHVSRRTLPARRKPAPQSVFNVSDLRRTA